MFYLEWGGKNNRRMRQRNGARLSYEIGDKAEGLLRRVFEKATQVRGRRLGLITGLLWGFRKRRYYVTAE